jgi:HlyD family secretion protein
VRGPKRSSRPDLPWNRPKRPWKRPGPAWDTPPLRPLLPGRSFPENIQAGEYVVPGTPIVTLGDVQRVYLRAYINETDLGRVKIGQKVKIATDAFPGKTYEGTITYISPQAEFTPKNIQTHKERVKLVYRIKVDIPNPDLELKPGMPADGEILFHP